MIKYSKGKSLPLQARGWW